MERARISKEFEENLMQEKREEQLSINTRCRMHPSLAGEQRAVQEVCGGVEERTS